MKNISTLFSFFAIALMMIACNEDDVPNTFTIDGDWEISKISVGWGQPDRAGAEIPFTDTYTFHSNGTFSRIIVDDELDKEASGVYVVAPLEDRDSHLTHLFYVNLTYHTGAEFASNCYSGGEEAQGETLMVTEDHLLVTTWQACDGPAYYYERR